MSLCPHGYTMFFDCPLCECPGCGRPQDICSCHEREFVYRATDSTKLPEGFVQVDGPLPGANARECDDALAPVRGIVYGIALSIPIWLAAVYVALPWLKRALDELLAAGAFFTLIGCAFLALHLA